MAVHLEQAAYRAISSDPRGDDDEAPVLGSAPAATLGEKEKLLFLVVRSSILVALAALMLFPMYYLEQANVVSFSVGLAGYEGIDPARPGHVVSPAFNLTLRMTKTCADCAEVVLTYSGVALGWARVEPRGCVSREPWGGAWRWWPGPTAWGSRGLSGSAWRRSGAARGGWSSTSMWRST